MRILIAEDDQVLADGLMRSLRTHGAAVDHVATGTEAAQKMALMGALSLYLDFINLFLMLLRLFGGRRD